MCVSLIFFSSSFLLIYFFLIKIILDFLLQFLDFFSFDLLLNLFLKLVNNKVFFSDFLFIVKDVKCFFFLFGINFGFLFHSHSGHNLVSRPTHNVSTFFIVFNLFRGQSNFSSSRDSLIAFSVLCQLLCFSMVKPISELKSFSLKMVAHNRFGSYFFFNFLFFFKIISIQNLTIFFSK